MKERKKAREGAEMDMKPVMGLFTVLIPLLLLSAEFAKISIIDISLPENRGSQTKTAVKDRPPDEEREKLLLTAIVTDSVVTLGARGGFLPSIYYSEFHRYHSRENKFDTIVEFDPKNPDETPINPNNGKRMTIYERDEIFLWAKTEDGNIIKCLHDKHGRVFVNTAGSAVTEVKIGDTLYTVSNPRAMIIVTNPSEYALKPMSAYSLLLDRLIKVKERYPDVPDKDDIIIAAENQVIYDKIVQIMDIAREAGFSNISISKLRV